MMARKARSQPTNSELEILRVLWQRGPSTVREVYETINQVKTTGYTTVLKLMQLMAQKGLLLRDESQRSHVYRASSAEAQTQRRLLGDLMDRAFEGSAAQLVLRALSVKRSSPEELEQIRQLLEGLSKEAK
jgi:BlaI family penicillinase repressor